MELNELTKKALDAAAPALGDGPVNMVNLLWFRKRPEYPDGFEGAKADARSAYYEGYVNAFSDVMKAVGVGIEVVYGGGRVAGLVAGPDDDWDDIAIVKYASFKDFRAIVEAEQYHRLASPHRKAAIRNWRLIATASK